MARILSLDDELEMLKLLNLILERRGYEHIYTTSEDDALTILRNIQVDLFTQDLMRPRIDGLALCRLMQADRALRRIPVLILTAKGSALEKRGMREMLRRKLRRQPMLTFGANRVALKVVPPHRRWLWKVFAQLVGVEILCVDGFLPKPFGPNELYTAIEAILQARGKPIPTPPAK